MTESLDRAAILELFEELSRRLSLRGATADLFVVGGGAIALAYDARRATRDLDAMFAPTDIVRSVVADIAEDRGLAEDWLNDAVKGFLPGEDPDARIFFESDSLRVDVASPRYLLAMKLMSARPGADIDDIRTLYRICGFTTVEEGLDVVTRAFPNSRMLPKTEYLLGEIVEDMKTRAASEEPDRT